MSSSLTLSEFCALPAPQRPVDFFISGFMKQVRVWPPDRYHADFRAEVTPGSNGRVECALWGDTQRMILRLVAA